MEDYKVVHLRDQTYIVLRTSDNAVCYIGNSNYCHSWVKLKYYGNI